MKKILFITLSNIGDIVLTLPALDVLMHKFPAAKITLMVGPNGKGIFENNPHIDRVIVFEKHSRLRAKIKLFNDLRKERFDAVIDFRNTFFGALLPAKYRTSPFLIIPGNILHMRERNLYRLRAMVKDCLSLQNIEKKAFWISGNDRQYISALLKQNNVHENEKIVVIAPGARSHIKRLGKDKFAEVCKRLSGYDNIRIIIVGDISDKETAAYIVEKSGSNAINFCGNTTIPQSADLLGMAALLISHDSSVMHMGGYVGVPTIGIFGPTDELRYGPWSGISATVKKDIFCRPCLKAQCSFGSLKCMQLIKPGDVVNRAEKFLAVGSAPLSVNLELSTVEDYKRILIVRTDRIGDVLLSTPVIEALRQAYPNSYIAIMVSPYAREIVEGNPYLDEVIIYDKDFKHKSALNSIKFAADLKKMKFDLGVILHPTNRVHLVAFLAAIKRRVGYTRKLGFLLTDKIEHTKQFGAKHESQYALDTVRYLGIETGEVKLFMPLSEQTQNWAGEILKKEGIAACDKLLGIHPAASCPSKIWPAERFALAADALAEKYGFKVLIFSGPSDIKVADKVSALMKYKNVNFGGKTSISGLAGLLKRCGLFISNDSGPVHIACAVGTPVICIFGRNQKGLSPGRWGPLGEKDKVLHKEIGCIECLAHNCKKEFSCLKAITIEDVIDSAGLILNGK